MVRITSWAALGLALTALATPAATQTLGRIAFPNSGAADAQAPFLRGVMLMHSFEYTRAAEAFREAQQADPGFALAYWGEAMTHTHPIWNEKDPAAARTVLARLGPTPAERAAKAGTERERAYLRAVEALYGEGDKPRLDTLYAREMEALAAAYPEDLEAQTFYALALLGLSQGVRDIPAYMRAGAIALAAFDRNPDHPGAAHYVIHAFDDPIHAPLGLRAARAYSRIAPDAPHAQHMTTHIFLALGMWDDVIAQNEVAAGHDHDAYRPGHYTAWRLYGLTQAGRHADARRHLEATRRNMAGVPSQGGYLLDTRAQFVINTEGWSDPVTAWEPPPAAWQGARATDAYALGLAALRRGDAAEAERRRRTIAAGHDPAASVMERALRGAMAHAAGRTDEGIALVREAAAAEDALPMEFGPPGIVKPTHELLGELLLEAGRPAEAAQAFERALVVGPGRWLALRGLARAATAAGDVALARRACDTWRANWRGADAPAREGIAAVCR